MSSGEASTRSRFLLGGTNPIFPVLPAGTLHGGLTPGRAKARGRFLADSNAVAHSSTGSAAVKRRISAIIDESQSRNPILHESL